MKNKKLFWGTMTILWVIVIFSFSLQPGEVSGNLSGSILEKMLGLFVRVEDLSEAHLELIHTIVRKCAHFTEFMILGVFAGLTVSNTKCMKGFLMAFCFCLVIASADETLQLFIDGRAGRIVDVLIDCSGSAYGLFLPFLHLLINNGGHTKATI